jgi:hypothetical protein
LDIYLGSVKYDKRVPAQDVRSAILALIVNYFQTASGFAIRISELYTAIRSARGVLFFDIERIATGTRSSDSPPETQSATVAGPTVAGTLLRTQASPGSVIIIIEQATSRVVCQDNGSGQFTVASGSQSVISSSIDYVTGDWTLTLSSPLAGGFAVTAQYSDIQEDYRRLQLVEIGGDETSGDYWPPPAVAVSSPVVTPPFTDGRPLTYLGADTPKYAPLQDIVIKQIISSNNFFDDTYLFNDDILYDSIDLDLGVVRCINLRKVSLTLVPE